MISREREFNPNRIMEKITAKRIKNICPNIELYEDNVIYVLYKSKDDTYPDIGNITKRFYNRPIFEHMWLAKVVDKLENFIIHNKEKRDKVVCLIEDLSDLPDVYTNKIEEIFDKYRYVLGPTCALYTLCYYFPSMYHALDIRYYKGKPTKVSRTLTMLGIILFTKGEITKEEVLNMWERITKDLDPTEIIDKLSYTKVGDYQKLLKDERFVNKKGEKIDVRHYYRVNTTKSNYFN